MTHWMRKHAPVYAAPGQLQALYQSLINGYWVPQSGLFLSFPGTGDRALTQQAATYDQGIAGMALLALGDIEKVRALLRFYERAWAASEHRLGLREDRAGLSNFYNAYFGVEGIEKTAHVGPNAWIGLLASRFYRKTGDAEALQLALDIAEWIVKRVPHTDGAVAMGEIPWNSTPWDKIHSTENNLSTYAFLNDLLKVATLNSATRSMLQSERDRIERWLLHKAYDPATGKVIRGFHFNGIDKVGAIDSYTWYATVLRPERLDAEGMPVERFARIATDEFAVTVEGRSGIDCVDAGMAEATYTDDAVIKKTPDHWFLRPHPERHRLVWYEGTGQYVVFLQDLARFAVQKAYQSGAGKIDWLKHAQDWLDTARRYTRYMDDASFAMPYGRAYPCATGGRFYLWGWPAPKSKEEHPSDALAALVWRLYVSMGYEPLSDTFALPDPPPAVATIQKTTHDAGTTLLYGASEEMIVRAWELYEKGSMDDAWRQARATIALWEDAARWLQREKLAKEGDFLTYYPGDVEQMQRIHSYWALNDVAAAYFIIGKIADEQKHYGEARDAFGTILRDFSLAQVWDARGWFWSPVESIAVDFVAPDPAHYGPLLPLLNADPPKVALAGNAIPTSTAQ